MRWTSVIFLFLYNGFIFTQNTNAKQNNRLQTLNSNSENLSDLHNLIYSYYQNEAYDTALMFNEKYIQLASKLNVDSEMVKALLIKGRIYNAKGDYSEAMRWMFSALSIAEKLKVKIFICDIYQAIANVFLYQKNYEKAKGYYLLALTLFKEIKDYEGIDRCLSNLGVIGSQQNKPEEALKYYREALYYEAILKDSSSIAGTYVNIGAVYYNKSDFFNAKLWFEKAFNIYERIESKAEMAIVLSNLSAIYDEEKNHSTALEYATKALKIAQSVGNKSLIQSVAEGLAGTYERMGNFKEAYYNFRLSQTYGDSIYSEELSLQNTEMQTKYESEKKEVAIKLLNKEKESQRFIIYAVSIAVILVSLLAILIFFGYRKIRLNNLLLNQKNEIIREKNQIVEQQNKDIKDSIQYAERIQKAILPPDKLWFSILPESFVFYLPKDILSGDFYWTEETDEHIFVAAADCTGHGVPGALMSVINYNLLNKAVLEKNLYKPGEILDKVNEWLNNALHQTYLESNVRDGMDITLLSIHKQSGKVLFSGANNQIYFVKKGEIHEVRGDSFPVGHYMEEKYNHFTTTELNINRGDTIYLFSDGIADQFGGPKGKKFKYRQLKEKLLSYSGLSFKEQKKLIRSDFLDWKGEQEQIDDILVIGIQLI